MCVWGKRRRNGNSTTPQVDIGSDEDGDRRNRTGVRSTCAAQCEAQKIQASRDAEERKSGNGCASEERAEAKKSREEERWEGGREINNDVIMAALSHAHVLFGCGTWPCLAISFECSFLKCVSIC